MIGLIRTIVLFDERRSVEQNQMEMAKKLADQIVGKSARLPLETKVLFLLIQEMVEKACAADPYAYRFNRESVRQYTGWNRRMLKVHIDRLEKMRFLHLKGHRLVLNRLKRVHHKV